MGAVFDHKAWRRAGNTYGSLSVGDVTQLNINGVATDFIVVHQGNPDGSLYDNSCGGTWLLTNLVYELMSFNPRSDENNDYENSSIHSYLNSTFLALFDSDVQGTIKQVKIPYRVGTSGTTVNGGSNGLSAKIFLLAAYETDLTLSYPILDGAALSYFSGCANSRRAAQRNANNHLLSTNWITRTPASSLYKVNGINDSGAGVEYSVTPRSGIRPCLIMPSNQKIFS